MKRFTTDNESNEDVTLVDNVTGEEYESNFEDIVDLMIDLHEENQQLAKEKQQLYRIISRLRVRLRDLKAELSKMKKESKNG